MKRSLDRLLSTGKRGLKFGKSLPIYLTLGLAAAFTLINAQEINKQEQVDKSYWLGDANQEVLLDTIPPRIDSYVITNPIFSPNGDGIKDTSTIDLKFSEEVDYEIEIVDSSKTIMKSWSGKDVTNPRKKHWDGTYGGSDAVAPDGVYGIIVSLEDSAGNTFTDLDSTITLDTTTELNIAGEPTAPFEYTLNQNYPNPFNPSTTISYSIPEGGHVSLIVYDIRGRKLETIVDETQAPGSYKVNFNASKYPSGIYFCRLNTENGYTDIKKMAVMK